MGAIWPLCFFVRDLFFDLVDFFDEVKLELCGEEEEVWRDTRRE